MIKFINIVKKKNEKKEENSSIKCIKFRKNYISI